MKQSGFSQFWNLRESPFFGNFEISEHHLLTSQRAVVTRLLLAAQQGVPVVGVFADEGAGSTTVARWLYENLPETSHFAMILSPGAQGVDPSHLTSRIRSFASARIPGAGNVQNMSVPASSESLKDQIAGLASVLDALQAAGKKLALIIDNAGLLAGESWAAYLLGILRQGDLVEHVLQFFLIGNREDLSATVQSWPRVLETRMTRLSLSRPEAAEVDVWLRNRLSLAGFNVESAGSVFSPQARKRLVEQSGCCLPKMAQLAEGAMIEAYLAGSTTVEASHVDRATHGVGESSPVGPGIRRTPARIDADSISENDAPVERKRDRHKDGTDHEGDLSLMDLIKPV